MAGYRKGSDRAVSDFKTEIKAAAQGYEQSYDCGDRRLQQNGGWSGVGFEKELYGVPG